MGRRVLQEQHEEMVDLLFYAERLPRSLSHQARAGRVSRFLVDRKLTHEQLVGLATVTSLLVVASRVYAHELEGELRGLRGRS